MINKSKRMPLFLLLLAQLLIIMDIFIINVALPAIRKGLQASDAALQLVIAAYLTGYAVFLITGGRFGDRYGRKKMFLLGMAGFLASSAACGLAQSALLLNSARFVQGISASLITPQILAYIQQLFPDQRERAKAFALYGITIGIGTMAGQFLGGLFSTIHGLIDGWRWIFLINLPIGLPALWAASRYLRETQTNKQERFDWSGMLLLASGLGCLILPLTLGRELQWPVWSIILLATGLVLILLFIVDQHRKSQKQLQPLMDTRLFHYPAFNTGILAVSLFFMMLDAYFLMLTLFLQEGLGLSASASGTTVVCQGAAFMLASLSAAHYTQRYGKRVLQAGVLAVLLSIGAQILLFQQDNIPFYQVCLLLFLHGAGVGLLLPSLLNAALHGLPEALAGAASGLYATLQQTATALGICLTGGFFFHILSQTRTGATPASYRTAFLYGNIINIILLALVLVLLQRLQIPVQRKPRRGKTLAPRIPPAQEKCVSA